MKSPTLANRRAILVLGFMVAPMLAATSLLTPALAAPDQASTFVEQNITRGLAILNDKALNTVQRREQFETFLLGLVDIRRIAVFTLGQYRRSAPPADVEAFVAAFKNYAVSAYQSYFAKYSGQTLKVVSSSARSSTDYIVITQMIDPHDNSGQAPLEVDFRVRTDTGRPVLVDVAVAGVWLSLEERDQFTAFLGQNNGDIHALISHLSELAMNLGKR